MLGRLLQAVEYYILIVTLTVSIFHRSEGGAAMVRLRPNRSSSFRGIGTFTRSTFLASRSPLGEQIGRAHV